MEKLAKYRQIVRELLISHATTNEPNIECQLIFDTEHKGVRLLMIAVDTNIIVKLITSITFES